MNMMENMFKRLERPWLKTPHRRRDTFRAHISVSAALWRGLRSHCRPPWRRSVENSPELGVCERIGIDPVRLSFIGAIILLKSFATSATNGGGGVGGTFAPSLYVGCMAGFLFAYAMNNALGLDLSIKNFALMGMAG